jgi:hypothetical protein
VLATRAVAPSAQKTKIYREDAKNAKVWGWFSLELRCIGMKKGGKAAGWPPFFISSYF